MKRFLYVGLLITGAHIMSSCKDSLGLTIIDESSRPISGANVVVQGMSIQGRTNSTSEDGKVMVNKNEIIGSKWVMVSKEGYENQLLDLKKQWPVVVVLKKQNGTQQDGAVDATTPGPGH